DTVTVTCSGVTGWNGGDNEYVAFSIDVPSRSTDPEDGNLYWLDTDFEGGGMETSLVAISCLLPPGVGINDTYIWSEAAEYTPRQCVDPGGRRSGRRPVFLSPGRGGAIIAGSRSASAAPSPRNRKHTPHEVEELDPPLRRRRPRGAPCGRHRLPARPGRPRARRRGDGGRPGGDACPRPRRRRARRRPARYA